MMHHKIKAADVFTPGEYPKYTYVERAEVGLERRLRDAIDTPGEVVSISGPSKSGKTVLVERLVSADRLIQVTGAGISQPQELWNRVLDWMDAPDSISTATGIQTEMSAGLELSGGVSALALAKAGAKAAGNLSSGRSKASTEMRNRRGMSQVIKEIASSDFIILLDDFHYMDRSIQTEIAKEIKEAARQKVKIITASVPHRADDVVRSNPELRGRTRTIDLKYWNQSELIKIAQIGFRKMNLQLATSMIESFANEASGSPQLMQAICLQSCFELDVREELNQPRQIPASQDLMKRIYQEVATRTDYRSLVKNMHGGPKKRGTERKEFAFRDGTIGDVYRCILLALANDPSLLGFDYNEIYSRIQSVCTGSDVPQAASIYQSCSQISGFAKAMYPNQRVIEWEDDSSRMDIIDPYFLFFLRWSGYLEELSISSM